MRVSAALKSLIHGVSTKAKNIVSSVFLKTQRNMRTDTATGLRRRPPTVLVSAGIGKDETGGIPFITGTDWIKPFVLRSKTYFLKVRIVTPSAVSRADLRVIDEDGVEYPVDTTELAYEYIIDNATREDIQLNVHGDTVFLTNSKVVTEMETDQRLTSNRTLLNVVTAPLLNEPISVIITRQDDTQDSTSIVVGATEGTNSVTTVAGQLATAIDLIAGLSAVSTSSIVEIEVDADDSEVTVQSSSPSVKVIGSEVETIDYLPVVAPVGKTIAVRAKGASESTALYLRSELDVTNKGSEAASQGIITFSDTLFASHVGWHFSSSGTGTLLDFNSRRVDSIQLTENILAHLGEFRLRVNISLQSTLPSGQELVRVVIRDEDTGNIAVDVQTLQELDATWGVYYYVSTTILASTALTAGTRYGIYFNPVGALSTNGAIDSVIWKETSKIDEPYVLAARTMPMSLTSYLNDASERIFVLDATTWDEKSAGNKLNNPEPAFIDKEITGTAIFQNRLLALSADEIVTSETDNTASFFRNTVSQQLATHPINIRSTASDSSPFKHALNHNKDLMLFTANAQYKLDGKVPLTPQTAGLPQVSSYSVDTEILPVSLGNIVYYGFSYGKSTGVAKHSSSNLQTVQESADSITDEVKGLISSNVELITGNASTGTIAVAGTDGTVYVCDLDTKESRTETPRYAWSTWDTFKNIDYTIEAISMTKTKVLLIVAHNSQLDLVSLDYDQDSLDNEQITYLDNQVAGIVDANYQITLPDDYILESGAKVIHAFGEALAGVSESYTVISPTVIELVDQDPDYIGVTMNYGTPFESEVVPNYVLGKDEGGKTNTGTNIRILRWNIHLNTSADVTAEIETPYAIINDQYWSGLISGDINTLTDTTANSTSIFKISFK